MVAARCRVVATFRRFDVSSPSPDTTTSATRQAILSAAKSLLAEQGRDALNMSRVARRARINRGTTYLHYDSREALLLDTLEDVSRELCAEIFDQRNDLVDSGKPGAKQENRSIRIDLLEPVICPGIDGDMRSRGRVDRSFRDRQARRRATETEDRVRGRDLLAI